MIWNHRLLPALTTVAFLAGTPALHAAFSAEAFDNSTIEIDGPTGEPNNSRFFNAQGNDDQFAEYGVADFSTADLGIGFTVTDVTAASLELTHSEPFFAADGEVGVWLAADTTRSIDDSTLAFDSNFVGGIDPNGGDFGNLTLLGTGAFTTGNDGVTDTLDFTLDATTKPLLIDALNSGQVRLVVAAETAGTAATYAGFDNDSAAGPTLNVTAVPEPASLALLGLGGLALIRRRR